jgi:hypothetical protein
MTSSPANVRSVRTPDGFEAAWTRGETRALRVDLGPATVGGISVFYLPYRPGLAGLRRAFETARALVRGVNPQIH